jgi:hypothetical protein
MRSFIICTPPYSIREIKWMGDAHWMRQIKMHREFWSRNLSGRYNFGNKSTDTWIILKLILEKWDAKVSPEFKKKISWIRWARHVARTEEVRKTYKILVGKPEGTRPFGRPRRRWKDNIEMDLKEIGWEGVEWIHLAQDVVQWRAVMKTVMKLRVFLNS